ncbi:glycosyltransferase [Glutamicibacter sp. AOP38-B1-38]|uniref:glycosyltransferase n=1 Tax=Glutamicibacter sp. AOP38-B1-38 TaxID=3457680 RepID=UPI004034D141
MKIVSRFFESKIMLLALPVLSVIALISFLFSYGTVPGHNFYAYWPLFLLSFSIVGFSITITLIVTRIIKFRVRRLEKYANITRKSVESFEKKSSVITRENLDKSTKSIGLLGRRVKLIEDKQAELSILSEELSAVKEHLNSSDSFLKFAHSELLNSSMEKARVDKYVRSVHDEIAIQRASLLRAAETEFQLGSIQNQLVSRDEFDERSESFSQEIRNEIKLARSRDLVKMFFFASRLDRCDGIFSHEDLAMLAEETTSFDPLMVAWIFISHDAISLLPMIEKRRLTTVTRQLGYWRISNQILRSIAEDTKNERDLTALSLRMDELEVFEGKRAPVLDIVPEQYLPERGHLLHVVGKVLPKTQSGYTLRTHYSASAQLRAGYKVSVVALIGEAENSPRRTNELIDGIDYYGLVGLARNKWELSKWLQANVDQLAELVNDIRPSALHAHSDFLNAYVASTVARNFNIPVIYESRGFWEESWLSRISKSFEIEDWSETGRHFGLPEAYALRQKMEVSLRSKVDHVVTLANVMKEHIVSLGGEADTVTVIPNAVDATEFPVSPPDQAVAEEIGIPAGAVVVGYISSIVEYEGIDLLIRGFNERATEELIDSHLLIVGDGAELETLKNLVQELGTPRVHFTGRVPHASILKFYSIIDIFVVPRRPVEVCHLVTPLKPFEAFSTGRAVIMSDVRALTEIAEQGDCARLFRAGDYLSLAEELVFLVKNPSAREELGKRAASWVRSERSWDRNAESYANVYEALGVYKLNTIED